MTVRPPEVRLAETDDAGRLVELVRLSDEEWSIGGQAHDLEKVAEVIRLATESGEPPRPIFGIIPGIGYVEGAIGLYPTEPWNSRLTYLRCFFHYVHPSHRKSTHARQLLRFGRWFAERSESPLILELLNPLRTEAKDRLYRREAEWVGGLYLFDHRPLADSVAA